MTGSSIGANTDQPAGQRQRHHPSTAGRRVDNGDIHVNDTVSWSANTLTLSAHARHQHQRRHERQRHGGLALEYGQASRGRRQHRHYRCQRRPGQPGQRRQLQHQAGQRWQHAIDYTIITAWAWPGDTTSTSLQGIGNNLAGHYVLGTDIDASATDSWNGGAGFEPIGAPRQQAHYRSPAPSMAWVTPSAA